MNSNYVAGRKFEYARMKWYKSQGYICWRSAGSHGPADITCVSKAGRVMFIQLKRCEKKAQADRLIAAFKANPPFGTNLNADFSQMIEVSVKELRGKILSAWI